MAEHRNHQPQVPVWLLDFDGVINASRPGWGEPPHRTNLLGTDGSFYRARWAPALVNRIRGLHLRGLVEIRWCTSWCPLSHELEAVLRLPTLACALTAEDVVTAEAQTTAKLRSALSVVENERRPLIWTDDDCIPLDGPGRDRLDHAGVPVHLVTPAENRGLQPAHIDAIEDFLTAAAVAS